MVQLSVEGVACHTQWKTQGRDGISQEPCHVSSLFRHLYGADAPTDVNGECGHPAEHGKTEEIEQETNDSAVVKLMETRSRL